LIIPVDQHTLKGFQALTVFHSVIKKYKNKIKIKNLVARQSNTKKSDGPPQKAGVRKPCAGSVFVARFFCYLYHDKK
jgi:hypothetical protein